VVAGEGDDPVGIGGLHVHNGLNDAAAVRAAVDVVAEEDELGRLSLRKPAAVIEQPRELVEAAVSIADREGKHGLGSVSESGGFFSAFVDEWPQDDLAIQWVSLEQDIHTGSILMKEGGAEINPDGFLTVALDDGICPEVGKFSGHVVSPMNGGGFN